VRKLSLAAALSILASGAAVALATGPASADPCGASSYTDGNTRIVGYRNCGGSTVSRHAIVGGASYTCYIIRAGSSVTLARVPDGRTKSWSVTSCGPIPAGPPPGRPAGPGGNGESVRKLSLATVMSILASGAAVAMSSGPAAADPCGASSYVTGGTRIVGYRNCGSSNVRRRAVVNAAAYPCYLIGAGSSLRLAQVANGGSYSWSVTSC
jgi:hypothetical protein